MLVTLRLMMLQHCHGYRAKAQRLHGIVEISAKAVRKHHHHLHLRYRV